MAGIAIEIVGTETGFHQFAGGVAFPDGPLPRSEHANTAGTVTFQGLFPFLRHDAERFVPGDGSEFAVLVIHPVFLAQQWLGQAVCAVHDLGKVVTLDAINAAIDGGIRIALGRDDATVLGADQHRATGAAETAGRFVPADIGVCCNSIGLGGNGWQRNARACGGGSDSVDLDKVAAVHGHDAISCSLTSGFGIFIGQRNGHNVVELLELCQ